MKKKRILVIGITMAAAGSEKSFLSFAETIDYNQYEVDLLLAKKTGDFLPLVRKEIRILEMGKWGDLFLIDKRNALRIIAKRYLLRNPFRIFELLPYLREMRHAETPQRRSYAANRLWLAMMQKMPMQTEEYDMALAYWGDRTMFYMIDKVKAKRKIAWLHFDYAEPPRENAVYQKYFEGCDKIVTVSKEIEHSLKEALPAIADRVITVENVIPVDEIRKKAEEKADFGDDFDGIRLMIVGRICPQKGHDLVVPALARLIDEGHRLRLYCLGKNDGFAAFEKALDEYGVRRDVSFLGVRENPYPLMRAADIYLQPSRYEGKPIAVEEAKVLCRPILVTAYTSASEQLENGRLGVIEEISAEGIYRGLKRLLEDAALRDNLSKMLSNLSNFALKENILLKLSE